MKNKVMVGYSDYNETAKRIFGCRCAERGCAMLRLPHPAASSSQRILHAYRNEKNGTESESDSEREIIVQAAACSLLASKTGECPREVRDVVNVFYSVWKFDSEEGSSTDQPAVLMLKSPQYAYWKKSILGKELQILRSLGFRLQHIVDHSPHAYVLIIINMLGRDERLAQQSWNALNDVMKLDMCIACRPVLLAVGAVCVSATDLGMSFAMEPPWYTRFECKAEEVMGVCACFRALYKFSFADPSNKKRSKGSKDVTADEWRYPECPQKGKKNHGRCAVCARAGFTKKEYEEYFKANPRRALPRPPVQRRAPPCLPFSDASDNDPPLAPPARKKSRWEK